MSSRKDKNSEECKSHIKQVKGEEKWKRGPLQDNPRDEILIEQQPALIAKKIQNLQKIAVIGLLA